MSSRPTAHGGVPLEGGVQRGARPADTIEEQPEMRSVALGTARAPTVLPGPLNTQALGKAPLLSTAKPGAGSLKVRKSFSVAHEWTGVTLPSSWEVKGENLEMIPQDFPLERTHREISCDASEVANRISECLRVLSIDAQYDNENARAKCKTTDYVKFRIRLYAGSEEGQPVIVEVQRRCGSASSFMRSCRAVLDSAEGLKQIQASANKTAGPSFSVANMKCLQSLPVSLKPNPDADAAAAFDTAANLCKSLMRDTVLMGLQDLGTLTDPLKTSPMVAARVSKWILQGEEKHSLRDILSALAIKSTAPEDPEDDPSQISDQQRHYAIVVFANALDMCSKDGFLSGVVSGDASIWIQSQLIPSLLAAVKDAQESAGNAYYAARGLSSLLSSSNSACRQWVDSNSGAAVLQSAHEFGLQRHDLLASETRQCLQLLNGNSL